MEDNGTLRPDGRTPGVDGGTVSRAPELPAQQLPRMHHQPHLRGRLQGVHPPRQADGGRHHLRRHTSPPRDGAQGEQGQDGQAGRGTPRTHPGERGHALAVLCPRPGAPGGPADKPHPHRRRQGHHPHPQQGPQAPRLPRHRGPLRDKGEVGGRRSSGS